MAEDKPIDNRRDGAPFFLPPSLSIAFDDIDGQHRSLIDIINRAAAAPTQLHAHLVELDASLASHFAHEEEVMREQGYPNLAEHKTHHAHILQRVQQITNGLRASADGARDGLNNIFTSLIDDILRADLPFKTFLQGKGLVDS